MNTESMTNNYRTFFVIQSEWRMQKVKAMKWNFYAIKFYFIVINSSPVGQALVQISDFAINDTDLQQWYYCIRILIFLSDFYFFFMISEDWNNIIIGWEFQLPRRILPTKPGLKMILTGNYNFFTLKNEKIVILCTYCIIHLNESFFYRKNLLCRSRAS